MAAGGCIVKNFNQAKYEWDVIPDVPDDPGFLVDERPVKRASVPVDAPQNWDFIDDLPDGVGLGDPLTYGTYLAADPESTPGDLSDDCTILPPERDPPVEKPDRSAHIRCWLGGSLIEAKRVHAGGPNGQVGGGIRGSITRFTYASRRRLLRKLGQTKRNAIPLFVCITYPDEFPGNPEVWKNDKRRLEKRLKREFKKAGLLWRLHTKPRLTGKKNTGVVAPHFHFLIWGVGLADLRAWLPVAWYEIVGSCDPNHLEEGTFCEMPMSQKAVMRYVSDEFAKVEQCDPLDGVGRWWGFVFKANIPWAEPFKFPVTDERAVQVMRWFRRFANLKARSYKTLTIFANAEFWYEKIRAGPDPPGASFTNWSWCSDLVASVAQPAVGAG